VRLVAGAVQDGDVVPGQAGAAVQQAGLVGLDDQQVVGLLAGDEELGGVGVGVQRVGGDHGAGEVQAGQQRLEGGHLTRGAVDLMLGEHRAGGVVHAGQQVDLPVVPFGAAQGLAVDRDRPPPLLLVGAVGKPRADHGGQRRGVHAGEGPADGGLGRYHPPVGGVAAGAERGTHRLRGIGGPLGDRGHRPGAGQDRGGGHGQDRGQRVSAAGGPPRVADGGEAAEQTCRVGWPERVGVGELGQGGRDRGWLGRHGRPSRS
jgi:hypothetical protein